MRTVETLIDEAAEMCGGQAKLARRLGMAAQRITAWKTGDEPISPENVALLCDVLELPGEETRRLAAVAIVGNPKNAKRMEALRRAFFVCLVLGVGFPLLGLVHPADAKSPNVWCGLVDGRSIVRSFQAWAWLWHALRSFPEELRAVPRKRLLGKWLAWSMVACAPILSRGTAGSSPKKALRPGARLVAC